MRLFTALWPPPEAVTALAAATTGADEPAGWRAVDPTSWHVTLAFHGEADPGVLARRLERAASGVLAPLLRISGAGAFPGVRWAGVDVGVQGDGPGLLSALVGAVGGDPTALVPHVTVLRWRSKPGPGAVAEPPAPWAGHRGPWWRPAEVLLVAGVPGRAGRRYRPVHRVELAPGGATSDTLVR